MQILWRRRRRRDNDDVGVNDNLVDFTATPNLQLFLGVDAAVDDDDDDDDDGLLGAGREACDGRRSLEAVPVAAVNSAVMTYDDLSSSSEVDSRSADNILPCGWRRQNHIVRDAP